MKRCPHRVTITQFLEDGNYLIPMAPENCKLCEQLKPCGAAFRVVNDPPTPEKLREIRGPEEPKSAVAGPGEAQDLRGVVTQHAAMLSVLIRALVQNGSLSEEDGLVVILAGRDAVEKGLGPRQLLEALAAAVTEPGERGGR